MGTRPLTEAVIELAKEKPALASRVTEIILAAPDINSEIFARDIAPRLATLSARTTLYASSKDQALSASATIHTYHRAGESGSFLMLLPGIQTIDATNVDTSFLGHSYFADNKSALSDIFYIIRDGLGPDSRFGLEVLTSAGGRYWRFRE
jgi:esterase/lipase superfamily enzyme